MRVLQSDQEIIIIPNVGQFQVNHQVNCSITSSLSLIEQVEKFHKFEGDATRVRAIKGVDLKDHTAFKVSQIALTIEIVSDQNPVDLKTVTIAYDKAVLKSIQQSMKNINNVYRIVVIKLIPNDGQVSLSISKESFDFLKQQGFEIVALNAPFANVSQGDSENWDWFLNQDTNLVIEKMDASGLEIGACIIDLDIP